MARLPAWAGILAAALVLACGPAAGRPLTVDDLLRTEGLGRTAVSPDGRWLVLERRRAYETAARFDFGLYTDLFRTRLEVVDLDAPARPRPLVPPDPGAGYALGPFSPDGRRLAVTRFKDGRWELGLADPAARAVRWTGLSPDLLEQGRSLAWRSPHELAVLALPDGLLPMQLRLQAPAAALAPRRATTAAGRASVTVVGSGRLRGVRPQDPPSRLLLLDARTGSARVAAEGRFEDLELSASGRWAALLMAGEDIALRADRPIQREYGLAKRRLRLRLVELATGRAVEPLPGWDLIASLLAWSPAADELLVFARRDGQPWTEGRLLRVTPAGAVRPAAGGRLAPVISGRPETVRAGWMGADPIVLARPAAQLAGRADWWRIDARREIALTRAFREVAPDGLVARPDRLLLVADGRGRLLGRDGRELAATAAPIRPPLAVPGPPFPRHGRTFRDAGALAGVAAAPSGAFVVSLQPDGRILRRAAPDGAELLAHGPSGALVRAPQGGADRLVWLDAAGAHSLATLNPGVADADIPQARPVRHRGPGGRMLTSWLVPPAPRRPGPPPPLVIWPYPGRTYPAAPETLHPRHGLADDPPRLLAAHGYAVLLPSLPAAAGEAVPSDGLAETLLGIVAAAAADPDLQGLFDPDRLALWGASFGGYGAIAAITQTDRFAAAVAQAAMPNLFAKWGDLSARRLWPEEGLADPGWTEDLQGDTRGPPWKETDRFLRGSPLLQMDRARTPLLLAHGELDNFPLVGAEQAFSAYLRQDLDAVLATYWGESHVLRSPGNLRDLYARALAFLDAHLGFTPPGPGPGTPAAAPASAAATPPPPPRAAAAGRRPAR